MATGVKDLDRQRIERAVGQIIEAIGENPGREGLADTPRRIAEMYEELFSGLKEDPRELLEIGFDDENHHEMVIVKDIPFYSMCEHHLLPFHGVAHVGYIPQGRILGVSKVARLVDMLARRPQVQERLTSQVADFLCEGGLKARGAGVVIEAEHLCYDRETEILTPRGWVRFDQLATGVQVAQVNPQTLEMTWAYPTDIIRYRYRGAMIHWRNDTLDLLVTPDHRMVFQREWAFDHKPPGPWEIAPAASLPGRFYIPQAVIWNGPGGHAVPFGEAVVPADKYAQFMPFGFRRVPQANRPRYIQFKSSHPGLYEDLRGLGKSGDKFVPAAVKMLGAPQIKTFLDWYAMGDGHRSRHNPLRIQFVSKSASLIDDVQELMLRVGMTGSVQRYPDCSRIETRTHKRTAGKGYKWYAKVQPHHRRIVDFDDEVFCVSVPMGAVLVRRNGRPVVSGNCMTMRGIKKPGSKVVTSATRGIFRDDPRTRAEFFAIVEGKRS